LLAWVAPRWWPSAVSGARGTARAAHACLRPGLRVSRYHLRGLALDSSANSNRGNNMQKQDQTNFDFNFQPKYFTK
jgi:hypothetical protein